MTSETKTRTSGVLAATCLSTLVVNANTSAVSILLPAISEDTGMSVDTLQWAVTGYSLVGAAVIVTSGSLGDAFGRKRVFQLGLALFVVSCVLIALANTGGVVIAGRMIQGAAGATILACGLSLLSVANTGQAQLRAVSLWGAAAAVGAAAGPLVGGVLVDITGWQGLFWIDAGVAVLCMVLTFFTVTESRDPNRPRSIDYAGTVLVALTLAPFILAVSKGGAWGWFSVATLACFAVAVASAFAFVAVERRVAVPMLDLAVLRNRVLVGASIAILIGAGTINGLMYLLSLYFQDPSTLGFPRWRPVWRHFPRLSAWSSSHHSCLSSPPGSVAARSSAWDSPSLLAASRRSASSSRPGGIWLFCCLWSQLPSEWGCPTDPPPLRQRLQSPPSKSERHPAFRIWPAMSAQR
jgi:MFS family permease